MTKKEILKIYYERKEILQEQIDRGKPFFGGEKTIAGWKHSVEECDHIIKCVEANDYRVTAGGRLRVPVVV